MKPYSERFPAAIAKAEGLLASDECGDVVYLADTSERTFTAGEVALAKALWHELRRAMDCMNGTERAALIAGFRGATIRYSTEKIERLGHD